MTPTQDYRCIGFRPPKELLKGPDAVVNSLIGYYRRRASVQRELALQAEEIEDNAKTWREMTDHQLGVRLRELREVFRRGGELCEQNLSPALGAIREAADRKVGLRAYPEQLMGALGLYKSYLVEMATGEGKTLTAGLSAVLAGWSRLPCHIVTVNDYLVERDAEWLKMLYDFCGLKAGCITATMDPAARKNGYDQDITYTTSKELLADFLRDRLRLGDSPDPRRRLIRHLLNPRFRAREGLVQRGLHTAIVDEADSILIDEAVTPLIISSPRKNEDLREATSTAHQLVQELRQDDDYRCLIRYREVELTSKGKGKLEQLCEPLHGIWRGPDRREELIRQALTAREFYQQGKQYLIAEGKIVIVDEFTGRPMPNRTWRQGMHQAIEAKESLDLSDPSETIARLSFQRFFRCFHRLAGMTGTGREAASEFWQIYQLPVITLPTHRPCVRRHLADRVYIEAKDKWQAIADRVVEIHAMGCPVLVGTRSVRASERMANLLDQRQLDYRLLNATKLQEEAVIIAGAGEPARITIATNMAGRGTDIILGKGVAAKGGLYVIATERHESLRVDRQLFGRAARQGDPGTAQAFVSTEDELLQRYLPAAVRRSLTGMLNMTGGRTVAQMAFTRAQRKAQRMATKQRRAVLKKDNWLEEALSFAGGEAV